MATNQVTHVKIPPPRQLNNQETLQSLQQWYRTFKQYYKRDTHFKLFTLSTTIWDPTDATFGFQAETTGLRRPPEELREDCIDFLHAFAGYMPYGYLTEKFISSITSLEEGFKVVCDHYGVSPSQESFLDIINMEKNASESYRQYHERILAFARQHLTRANVVVDGVHSGIAGDSLTISHMNLLTLMWLKNIHPSLINIVKTEYSLELRQNTQLSELVPRISVNIDNLLERYDQSPAVKQCGLQSSNGDTGASVNKIQRKQPSYHKQKKNPGKSKFCPGCFYLGDKLGVQIQYSHSTTDCPRKNTVVKMVQMEEDSLCTDDDILDLAVYKDGKNFTSNTTFNNVSKVTQVRNKNSVSGNDEFTAAHLQNPSTVQSLLFHVNKVLSPLRKEKSPSIVLTINGIDIIGTLDEGAEVSCISLDAAKKLKLSLVKTDCSAVSADKIPMRAIGQTSSKLVAVVKQSKSSSIIDLGHFLVISNLGVDLLIGQPTKVDTSMVSVPHKRIVYFRDINNLEASAPYHSSSTNGKQYMSVTARKCMLIYPNEHITVQLPSQFVASRRVCVTPKKNQAWLRSNILPVVNNTVCLKNESQSPQLIDKKTPIADIRSCIIADTKSYDGHVLGYPSGIELDENLSTSLKAVSSACKVSTSPVDPVSLQFPSNWDYTEDFTQDVSIDPDNCMSSSWKQKFKHLVTSFKDVINYRPGRYNGSYGYVDNTIDFSSPPPPTSKIHMPNYSEEMLLLLAEKMDELEKWKVLVTPDSVGVTPVYVSPSLLVPKDVGKWRVVTNFTGLNNYIRKTPALSPTIEEVKLTLAKFKFIASLDLSHYYFQNGMSRYDMQFLATHHPFKGIRMYAVEPQGLKNASEHSYERLARVIGDFCQRGIVTRQADGVYVGGNSELELHDNLSEVLQRFRDCCLTVKPSKFIINPKKIVLFGWEKDDEGWRPLKHTISPLVCAEPPTTVKQLRSWLGAAKQVSQCILNYASIFSPLETATGGRGSSERIVWTDSLLTTFQAAKTAVNDVKTVHFPHPDDTLHLYTDYSQQEHAVGGRMEVHRTRQDGSVSILHGGFFSAKIPPSQARWQPCEGESLAVRLLVEHFRPILRESNNVVLIHCDNLPTCQAWQRSKQGFFSNSAKISAFLISLSTLNVELVHRSGQLMKYADYASRHPTTCDSNKCQICKFTLDMSKTADCLIRNLTISDIESGKFKMPLAQREAWRLAQSRDFALSHLLKLVKSGQLPEKKKTCGDNTTIKALHNLYKKGELHVDKSDLITVRQKQSDGSFAQTIVVPKNMFPGLANALHVKTSHPSKMQLTRLLSRHFYSPGQTKVISDISDKCYTCLSLKQLPKELFPQVTTAVNGFGSNFSADVIVRLKQKILLVRENLSQFVFARLIPDETADTLMNNLVPLISDFVPESGSIVRTDNAPAFQKLLSISSQKNSIFNSLNITLQLGDALNPNKNPIAENAVKELEKEFLRLGFSNKQIQPLVLSLAVKNINSRIRQRGFSSKEMCFTRSQTTNENIRLHDPTLSKTQVDLRTSKHNTPVMDNATVSIGTLVMIKDKLHKNEARETYVVVQLDDVQGIPYAVIQKFDDKFMNRQYRIPVAKLIILPNTEACTFTDFDDDQVDLKLNHSVAKIDKKDHNIPGQKANIEIPTHSWDYEQFCDLEMEDVITFEIQESMPDIPDDLQASEVESSNHTLSSLSDAANQDDDIFSTDRPSTPASSEGSLNNFPLYVQVPNNVNVPNLYPDHPDDVNLHRVQHLEHALSSVPIQLDGDQARRSSRQRQSIDYAQYHSFGRRSRPRRGGDGGDGGTPRLS